MQVSSGSEVKVRYGEKAAEVGVVDSSRGAAPESGTASSGSSDSARCLNLKRSHGVQPGLSWAPLLYSRAA